MPHALTSRSDKDSRPLFFRPFLPLKGDGWDVNGETREGHRVKHQHGTMDDDIFHAPTKMAPSFLPQVVGFYMMALSLLATFRYRFLLYCAEPIRAAGV